MTRMEAFLAQQAATFQAVIDSPTEMIAALRSRAESRGQSRGSSVGRGYGREGSMGRGYGREGSMSRGYGRESSTGRGYGRERSADARRRQTSADRAPRGRDPTPRGYRGGKGKGKAKGGGDSDTDSDGKGKGRPKGDGQRRNQSPSRRPARSPLPRGARNISHSTGSRTAITQPVMPDGFEPDTEPPERVEATDADDAVATFEDCREEVRRSSNSEQH